MVTLRREAKTESERYGGYTTKFSNKTSDYDNYKMRQAQPYADENVVENSHSYDNYLWQELQRTNPRKILKPQEINNAYVSNSNAYEQAYQPRYNNYKRVEPVRNYAIKKERAFTLNTKAKSLIITYIMVVILFVSLIVVNAGAMSVLNSQLSTIESNITATEAIINTEKNALLIAKEELMAEITNSGMYLADSSGSYTLLPLSEGVEVANPVNWFDSVCDFISHITGG